MADIGNRKSNDAAVAAVEKLGAVPGLVDAAVGGACRLRSRAVEAALATEDKEIVVVAQRDPELRSAERASDLFTIGTRAAIRRWRARRAITIEVLVFGLERVVIVKVDDARATASMTARVRALPAPDDSAGETEALTLSHRRDGHEVRRLDSGAQSDAAGTGADVHGAGRSAAAGLHGRVDHEPGGRGSRRCSKLRQELEALRLVARLAFARSGSAGAAQQDRGRSARRNVAASSGNTSFASRSAPSSRSWARRTAARPRSRLCARGWTKADLPDDVRKEAERELGRLEKMQSAQPEYNIIRTWLEYVIELPWNKRSEDNLDIEAGAAGAG